MAGKVGSFDAAQGEVVEDSARRQPCRPAREGQRAAVTGQVVGDGPDRAGEMGGDPVPGAVGAAETVEKDDCRGSRALVRGKERGSHGTAWLSR